MIWRERERPMPDPVAFVVKNGIKIEERTSGGIGFPSLLMVMLTRFAFEVSI
jgi:hypothetical protein